jgi:prevent-host-death family protein
VRELKAKLSEYVGRAAAGESIIVTDRGRPVARLTGLDTAAPLTKGIDEHDSGVADALIAADPVLVTSRIAEVEVRRTIARLLNDDDAATAKRQFLEDLDAFALVAVDATTFAGPRLHERSDSTS